MYSTIETETSISKKLWQIKGTTTHSMTRNTSYPTTNWTYLTHTYQFHHYALTIHLYSLQRRLFLHDFSPSQLILRLQILSIIPSRVHKYVNENRAISIALYVAKKLDNIKKEFKAFIYYND